jgi:methionyl-tRNA formyltransferase
MRLVFAGTPRFAAVILQALVQRGHEPALVLTQPDKPAGRGLRETYGPVKRFALERGIAVEQPRTLRDSALQARLRELAADVWVVAAYGLLLPAAVLEMPPLGCLNVHASLLPRWRGAAPIQRAILAGDRETGISIMRMDEGLDTGPVYLRRVVPIDPRDTAGSLHDRLAEVGAAAICEVLDVLPEGALEPRSQSDEGACYAHKLVRDEARLDWSRPAAELERQVRAFDPVPGAFTRFRGENLKIWSARLGNRHGEAAPGTVLAARADGIEVQCGEQSLIVTALQRAGSRRLEAGPFLRGQPIEVGARLGD